MNLHEWFHKGVTPDTYIEAMEQHKENLLSIYDQFMVPEEDLSFFNPLRSEQLRAIVITEDWCGDAMLNVPIYLRIAEAGGIETRFLKRDENLELMDQYLTNGKSRSIPKIIVINKNGGEIFNWGPRAPKLQAFIDKSLASLPPNDAGDFKEKQQEMFQFVSKAYRDNKEFHSFVYQDIKKHLLNND
ncbi:thioredoxin family protein [Halobacillus naozhouensis]|uniref:Thioredoxin family protein n=1 Tax=Halobacillus naozhouensis TaxID=554880 RepID=A0ABY8IWI7_9BACI|nr:thioredoxin family protein [Halobacillus naozhouensis]WFT73569.1 thioredoxin family protein [Halobacillus naozhouensis]